jgi:hypothetical protein
MRTARFAIVLLLALTATAGAWRRPSHDDATVVQRSEIIVVGHLDWHSVVYVPHESPPGVGISREHHATLIVAETLKGSVKDKQIPIVINYGLDPLVGGKYLQATKGAGLPQTGPGTPKDRVDIIDTGNSSLGGPPVLVDAQKDNVWCLRHLGGELGREPGKGPLGIVDPEDVAALKFKGLFKALLSADKDGQIAALLADPDEAVVARVLRHLAARQDSRNMTRITSLLSSPNKNIQAPAWNFLAVMADRSAVPMFRKALTHAKPEIRTMACVFLCRFRDTESIPAIGEAMRTLEHYQRLKVCHNLSRMESREAVDLLLAQLDEHLDPNSPSPVSACQVSACAAEALWKLTGTAFPLNSAEARRQWDKLKAFPDEVLLRKSMLQDIDALTDESSFGARAAAYEALGRLANQHFGSYNAFHEARGEAARRESQDLWRAWAGKMITRPRSSWILDGFAKSGIVIPGRMDAGSVDTLIDVLDFYDNWRKPAVVMSRPGWVVGWVQANFHRYNANRMLEQITGHMIGLSPYYPEQDEPVGDGMSRRWAAWWKENRGKVELLPLPEEKPVSAEMLSKAPSLRAPGPLSVSIQLKDGARAAKSSEALVIFVEVRNVSDQDVQLKGRPCEINYAWNVDTGAGGSGGNIGTAGNKKEDYVTLKSGQAVTWRQEDVRILDRINRFPSIVDFQYILVYRAAGSQFGLSAWRGSRESNRLSFTLEWK